MQMVLRGPTTWKDMRRNSLNGTANWQTKQLSNCSRSPHHALTTISSKNMETVGEVSKMCSQIVLKCLHLARIGRPDILWSVNKLTRAVTKWTRACAKRLALLISHIHNTSDFWQYCHVRNAALLDYPKTQTLLGTLKTQHRRRVVFHVSLGAEHSFPQVECARNKHQCHTVPSNLR